MIDQPSAITFQFTKTLTCLRHKNGGQALLQLEGNKSMNSRRPHKLRSTPNPVLGGGSGLLIESMICLIVHSVGYGYVSLFFIESPGNAII